MSTKEHETYQKEFAAYAKKIIATKKSAEQFLVRAGINTPTGRLSKNYSSRNLNGR